jgi:hypothetical protein
VDTCDHCGKMILPKHSSVYDKRPDEDIGRTYHTACVEAVKDARIVELEALAQKLIGYCDGAMHMHDQYHDERGQLIEIANGGTGRGYFTPDEERAAREAAQDAALASLP